MQVIWFSSIFFHRVEVLQRRHKNQLPHFTEADQGNCRVTDSFLEPSYMSSFFIFQSLKLLLYF